MLEQEQSRYSLSLVEAYKELTMILLQQLRIEEQLKSDQLQ